MELGIKLHVLNFNEMCKVDSVLDIRADSRELLEKYLMSFIALVGETFIAEHPTGKWKMHLSEDDLYTWHPYIAYRNYINKSYLHEFYKLILNSRANRKNILQTCYADVSSTRVAVKIKPIKQV
jgi:hypothetical protein